MAMRFDHPFQHGLKSITHLERLQRKPDLNRRLLLRMTSELVAHGHKDAILALDKSRATFPSPGIQAHCDELQKAWNSIRKYYRLEDLDEIKIQKIYRKNVHFRMKGSGNGKSLIVIFTTMFNNFWMSTASLAYMLSAFAGHILVLKDATRCNYFNGAGRFAANIPEIAAGISQAARTVGADRIYVSGFSSGGYAALLTSLLLPSCAGYLGFSHMVDRSARSLLPQGGIMSEELKASFDQRWFCDLKELLQDADRAVPRTLIYGGLSEHDTAHARHLEGLDSIRLACLPDAEHNTILKLLASDSLHGMFEELTDR